MTQNSNATSTPTSVPATQSSSNGGGTGSPPPTSTPPTTQGGGGGGIGSFLLPLVIGLIATFAIAAVCLLGFVFLRRRMLPNDHLRSNLPPSGARPWSRFRQGSMHGGTNLYTQQTLADAGVASPFSSARSFSSAVPFSAAIPSWAMQVLNPQDNPNAPQWQGSPATPANAPFAGNPLATQGIPPVAPVPPVQQQPFVPSIPPQGPAMPPAQLPPSWQPNNTSNNYPAQWSHVPQQDFPPQQGFPSAQPNIGFSPSNYASGDIALALDALHRASSDPGNVAHHKPSPVRLRGIATGETDDIPQLASTRDNIQNIPGTIQGIQDIPETPRLRSEAHSEQLPTLDASFFRDAFNRLNPQGKNDPDEQPPDNPNWL